ncbi:hypothetical protein LEP1GSC050_2081 [Leptospira broomii serovar Hurstbridge str. 5399]|uniref:Uncharacterized protein n=1 Tax=Leptospira broomii serovar Hurstbridge str. 5399 TaxID=1049789 RepID=T0FEB2_9LEPT|nr:hypothetical protein LEP1GSC050_2081 [Leptospira broomii serovar Hurstbridge str. 5399]
MHKTGTILEISLRLILIRIHSKIFHLEYVFHILNESV